MDADRLPARLAMLLAIACAAPLGAQAFLFPRVFPKATAGAETGAPTPELPPLPEGVSELKFAELFLAIADRGLEYTPKAKALDGKRVRILGYMVRSCSCVPGRFMLTPVPVTLHDHEMGPCDDLPATTVFVDVPPLRRALQQVQHLPGLFLATGKLSLGGRDETDGRRSWVRLELERPAAQHPAIATRPEAASDAAGSTASPAPATSHLSPVSHPEIPTVRSPVQVQGMSSHE